jgi:hypothetical protein
MQSLPHPRLLPVAQAPPARHPAAAAQLLGQHLPGNATVQDVQDPRKGCPIWDVGPSAFGFGPFRPQERREKCPQRVTHQWLAHARNLPRAVRFCWAQLGQV